MTNTRKLKIILSLIKQYLQKKKKSKNWILPDDKRYTTIVKKYKPKLSSLWRKTRDSYLKKFKEKDFTDFNDDPEQYEDPSFDSSDYIDEALLILAFAFGEGVIIGYEELLGRDVTVDIPDDPHNIFNQAKEIKNYEWAALSYEQKQMDDIFNEYNKTIDGSKEIKKWFDINEYRLTELVLGGLIWYAIQYGFTRGVIESQDGQGGNKILAYWITEEDTKVCDNCKDLEDGNPYSEDKPLPTLPGGGKTICGSKCRCIVDFK